MTDADKDEKQPPARPGQAVERGKKQLLIAPRRGLAAARAGVAPMSAGAMKGMLEGLPGLDVVRVLKPKKQVQTLSAGFNEATDVYVVRTDKDRAELIKQAAPANMIVEDDAYLDYGALVRPMHFVPAAVPNQARSNRDSKAVRFRVVDDAGTPIPDVHVTLTGDAFPSEGNTNEAGEIQLDLVTLPNGRARSLYVKANHDFWDRFVVSPELSTEDVNVITLWSLKKTIAGFPQQFKYGWGQRAMGLDLMPDHAKGKGVKIAIIDSGADNTHPLLKHLTTGVDFTNNADPTTWATDTVGHGSHCAGVIAARSAPGLGFLWLRARG